MEGMTPTIIRRPDRLTFMEVVEAFGLDSIEIFKKKEREILDELMPVYDRIDYINNSTHTQEIKDLSVLFLTSSLSHRDKALIESLKHMRKVVKMTRLMGIGGRRSKEQKFAVLPTEEARNILLLDIYGFEKLKFKRNGFTALCPFHTENTPSFSVKGNRYKCFGCEKSGDTIQFVMDLYKMNFVDAVKWLLKLKTRGVNETV